MCKQESSSDNSTKIYTRKELIMTEATIYEFHTSFYIPAIQKLAFNLPNVRILVKNHCDEMRRTAFKLCELFQDIICRRDYADRVVTIFANQIQSEYYCGNISVYIEGIALEHFSAFSKNRYQFNYTITSTSYSISLFLSDNSKQDAAATNEHRKSFISLIKEKSFDNIIVYNMGKH